MGTSFWHYINVKSVRKIRQTYDILQKHCHVYRDVVDILLFFIILGVNNILIKDAF